MKTHITNIISRQFGRFASHKFPAFIQGFINQGYVSILGLDMGEFDEPKSYSSLNALFTRALKRKREIDGESGKFISPCDALISEQGEIENGTALQIKGFSYKVSELLTPHVKKSDKLLSGCFINFYLSPKDYHRFHSPVDMRVLKAIHVSQKLYPVNFTYLKKVDELFCKNERVILECEDKDSKIFYLVFVGALNVGKIVFTFDDNISTNASYDSEKVYKYENLSFKKGDELGRFEMGSTIVVLFEDENVELLKGNEKVRFGEAVAKI